MKGFIIAVAFGIVGSFAVVGVSALIATLIIQFNGG